ncbi:helix-turn-helix domain-containing protein [Phyllobacterium sp. SYP-B3895]|uniref:helix-turn-helix domain-containing protein n=1 Tax=Phyllobacterium sp. SYP-B3895 TaxID=2663240 RepID=UPI001299E56B|nr:helix-turn-helix transcriptional regulator [Phyllobacterium sp. SYP-B3895]MRG56413.1 helix-turn-helix domain-containing protein [Phyllobacterium sp. SYP-B3895]
MSKSADEKTALRKAKNAARMRQWRAKNPLSPEQKAKEIERIRKWHDENPERRRAYQQKMIDRKRQGLQAAAKAEASDATRTRGGLTMAADRDDRIEQELGRKLKALRVAAGISQSGLGAALGVSRTQIQKYERGETRLAVSTLIAICNVLRRDPMVFLAEQFPDNSHSIGAPEA